MILLLLDYVKKTIQQINCQVGDLYLLVTMVMMEGYMLSQEK